MTTKERILTIRLLEKTRGRPERSSKPRKDNGGQYKHLEKEK